MTDQSATTNTVDDLWAAAKRAQANYDYETAAALFTKALEQPDLPPSVRTELLSGRAYCLGELGLLREPLADWEQVLKLAESINDDVRQVQAMNEQVRLLAEAGDFEQSLRLSAVAGELAERSGNRTLVAESYLAQAHACFYTVDLERMRRCAERAAQLFREMGERDAEARAIRYLGVAAAFGDRPAKAEEYLRVALDEARRLGDLRLEAQALEFLGIVAADYARQRAYMEEALRIFRAINNRSGQMTLFNNLALAYLRLGLYERARHLAESSLQIARDRGPAFQAYALETLGRIYLYLGLHEQAGSFLKEGLALPVTQGHFTAGFYRTSLGQVALAEQRHEAARAHFEAAVELFEAQDQPANRAMALSLLGAVHLAQGKAEEADQATKLAIEHVQAARGVSIEYPSQDVWWLRYQALTASEGNAGESHAGPLGDDSWEALEKAQAHMLEVCARLSDEGLRRNYLNKVAINRKIVMEWTRRSTERNVALANLDQPATTAQVQEQLKRVAEVGMQLTAERDPETLAGFIVDVFIELSGAERALLLLHQDDQEGEFAAASSFDISDETPAVMMETAQPLLKAVKDTRSAMVRHDLGHPPRNETPDLFLRTAIALPLIAEGRLLGMLYGDMRQIFGRFGRADLDLLSLLANQATAALENARWTQSLERRVTERTAELQTANQRLQERNVELTVLNSIGKALSERLEVQAIYDTVGDKIRDIFDAQTVIIVGYEHQTEQIHFHYMIEKGERLYPEPAPFTGLARHLIETGEPILVTHDIEGWRATVGAQTVIGQPAKSAIFVPLMIEKTAAGAISLQNVEREYAFDEADVRLLSTLAASMSVALENARLFDETNRLLKETKQRNAELKIINSIGHALAQQLDFQAIIDLVGERIGQIFQADTAYIVLYDRPTHTMTSNYYVDRGQRQPVQSVPVGAGLTSRIIEQRQAMVIGTKQEGAKLGSIEVPSPEASADLNESYLGVPMLVGSELKGVVSVQSYRKHAYGEGHVRLLSTIVANMSVALENARLFDQTSRLLAETRQRVAELKLINEVGKALAAQRDMQAIYDLVGDRIRDIFDAQVVTINSLDPETRVNDYRYVWEKGQRLEVGQQPFNKATDYFLELGGPWVIHENIAEIFEEMEVTIPAGETPLSMVAVPLTVGDRIRGYISLQNVDREHAFDESDVRLLSTLASSMSVALENTRLFDETSRLLAETQQRNAELTIINSIGQALVRQLSFQAIIDLVGEKIGEIFAADTTYIALFERETQTVRTIYYVDRGVQQFGGVLPLGQGLVSRVIESGAPVCSGTMDESRRLGAVLIASPDSAQDLNESWLGVPMCVGEEVRGVVSVQSYQQHAFDEGHVRLLSTIAANMTVALENARLFDETSRLLEETQQRAAELATVNQISQALASELELDTLIELVGDQMRQTFDADIAYVALHDRQTNQINFPYLHGEEHASIQFGAGLTSHILESGQPLLINEDVKMAHQQLGTRRVGVEAQSYLGAPIFVGGETIGVISVQSTTEEGRFDEDDVRLLTTIAANVGAAIHNAQLYQETQRRAEEMAALAEIGRDISSVLDLSAVLERIALHACDLLDAEDSAVYMPDEAGQTFQAIVAVGPIAQQVKASPVSMGEGIMGDMARRLEPELVNDTAADPRVVYIPGTPGGTSGRLMASPLIAAGRLTGLMAVWRPADSVPFTEVDLSFLVGLSRQAAIAIENARLFAEAEAAQAAAEAANRAKSTFLANMSHELRTPLNAIMGFTRIVKRRGAEVLPEKQIDNLDKVLVSAEHLLGLINAVLDISKIEAGRMDVQPAPFSLASLVDLCLTTTQPLLKRGVKLGKEVAEDLPSIYSDQEKIKQILLNLLSNAAKFTEEGQILLSAHAEEDHLIIDVSDTGIGIPPSALGRIFEEFLQVDGSMTRQYGGTGLGLSISRQLARLLGGDLFAASNEGQGSTFTLMIPIRYGESPPTAVPASPERQAADDLVAVSDWPIVLAIDDDPDAVYLLKECLGEAGYQVIGATSGDEGLRKARELQPFAITLDILMPQKDGWQVLHELKTDPITRDIAVILVTIVDKKDLGYRLGATDYLVKPLDEKAVLGALGRLVQIDNERPTRLLVVDDDPQVHDMLGQLLEGERYELETAADGQAALEAIAQRRPDAILLDLLMPRLDGFGVIEHLGQDPDLKDIPVVVLTAKGLTAEEASQLERSVARVIRKRGLNEASLLQEIRRALGHMKSAS